MSKRSREKHARVEFQPAESDTGPSDDDLCDECGFFTKRLGREICEACCDIELPRMA